MAFAGLIKCADCGSPLSMNAYSCPYCHSTAPARAPWRRGSWLVLALVGIAVVCVGSYDQYFGTHVLQSVQDFFQTTKK